MPVFRVVLETRANRRPESTPPLDLFSPAARDLAAALTDPKPDTAPAVVAAPLRRVRYRTG